MAVYYHWGQFPPNDLEWKRLLPLIGPANAAIARYEGVLRGVPNPDVLLSPLTSQEAVLSSRIEGTQATLSEVLEYEAEGEPNAETTPKKADAREVLNYRAALLEGARLLEELPLSQRLVRRCHTVLMQGVRGRGKAPGAYRTIPNWIGPTGCGIEDARFVPCDAAHIDDAMSAWEKYLHYEAPDLLIQLAIAHAEFEAIHPFLDGNGRLGRLLIPLFLKAKGLLSRPNFYLSEHLERNREEYYDRLYAVSSENDWTGWCEFFLNAIIGQAERNQRKAQKILDLYNETKEWVVDETRSQYAVHALDWFFSNPIFRTTAFFENVEIPKPTAQRILRIARDHKLLRTLRESRGRQPAVLAFPELLNISEGADAF
jgi:Fic family protein